MSAISKSKRLTFVDQYRGLIMVLMALDHALYFWSSGGRISNEGLPLMIKGVLQFNRPDQFKAWGYLAMLLSSLAAPGFLFLAGYVLSRSLESQSKKGMTQEEITRQLFRRGLTLVALQLFVISPAFNLPAILQSKSLSFFTAGTFFSFSVLSTIGTGFFFLALMKRFSPWVTLITTLSLYAGGELFLPNLAQIYPSLSLAGKALVSYFLLPVPFSSSSLLNQNFPVIPWLVPIILGWLFGQTFNAEKGPVYEGRRFLWVGLSFLTSFFILRLNNLGDYLPYDGSFSNLWILSKYPPSPDYLLFFTGIMFCLFYALIHFQRNSKHLTLFENLGQVPLFFYTVHLWIYASIPFLFNKFNVLSIQKGFIIWILGLCGLYPLSQQYLKSQKKRSKAIFLYPAMKHSKSNIK